MKENYQEKAKELFGNSCYLYCLAYLTGLRQFKEMTKQILEWWYAGYCDDSGFVNSPNKCIRAKDVRIIKINKIADIPTEPTIIEMKCPNGGSHFIVGKRTDDIVNLVFDPAGISNSWKAQKFLSYREYIK